MIEAGVDAWNLMGDHRGIGRYVRALLHEWSRSFAGRISVTLVVPEWHTWTVARRYRGAAGGLPYPVVSRAAYHRRRFNVMWFPFNGPTWSGFAFPSVATLHDASPFVLPEYTEGFRKSFFLAARHCDRILTDSEFSHDELVRVLQIDPERISAVPLGVAPPLPARPVPLDVSALGPFALFTGETSPRKGLDTLVEALARLRSDGLDLGLVVAGTPTPYSTATLQHAQCRVHALGHVDDATLAALYRACAVCVYPSRYEGFGLPVLEAMSYGAPVIASSAAGIPEAGGDAPLYFTAGDADALAAALRTVTQDAALARSMRERGYARAAGMPWRTTAERTLAVLEEAAR
jgi:glycosyltransferase involved in cell wall biosynthesis